MKTRPHCVILLFCLTALLPQITSAQIQTRAVVFPKGSSTATIKSSVTGSKTIDYTVSANSGDFLKVSLKTNNGANYFNLLPPGSNDVAVFIGSTEGNECDHQVTVTGTYKIRVYLMRSAARRNEKGTFTLTVTREQGNATSDAKVAGTNYSATGILQGALGNQAIGTTKADFGVIRYSNGSARVHITFPGRAKRSLYFSKGLWSCDDPQCNVKATRIGDDEWDLVINGDEKVRLPDAVIVGG